MDSARRTVKTRPTSVGSSCEPVTRTIAPTGTATALTGILTMRASAAAATPKGYARRLPLSITYDVAAGIGRVVAEVGPDKARPGLQGALGNFLAFGSRNNAPVWDFTAPLAAEAPVVENFLGAAGQRLLS